MKKITPEQEYAHRTAIEEYKAQQAEVERKEREEASVKLGFLVAIVVAGVLILAMIYTIKEYNKIHAQVMEEEVQ